MPKIRDLAINAIPSESPVNPDGGRYWMSNYLTVAPPPGKKGGKPKPKPSTKKAPAKKSPAKKKAGELPADAVAGMKQELQQRVKRSVQS